jgi:putative transposase
MVYHVLNRAHSRQQMFFSDADYQAFVKVLIEAHRRWPVKILSFCLMPNHWHLVLEPTRDGELSLFMRWLTQTHTQRWRHAKRTVGDGSLYQGRYKSFLVESDEHFLILCRYVERNALRAKLVRRAEDWKWGSAWVRRHGDKSLGEMLSDWPVDRPGNWIALLNEDQDGSQERSVRASITRNRPLGREKWVQAVAKRYDLEHTLRQPGRPRKEPKS